MYLQKLDINYIREVGGLCGSNVAHQLTFTGLLFEFLWEISLIWLVTIEYCHGLGVAVMHKLYSQPLHEAFKTCCGLHGCLEAGNNRLQNIFPDIFCGICSGV